MEFRKYSAIFGHTHSHLFVYKSDTNHKTTSSIKPLNKEERISEIAKMLSTGIPTEIALKNAKELLNVWCAIKKNTSPYKTYF